MKSYGIILLSTLLLSSCLIEEYRDTIQRENTPIISSGSTGTISDGEIAILPNKDELSNLIDDIDNARERIWIEIYTWTEKSTIDAVIRAKKRGVDVKIILEGNVYRTPWINNETIKKLKNNNIEAIYADNIRYNFTHIKLWIIDTNWCVSTGNWSYSAFTQNRDFIFCSKNRDIMRDLEEIFLADFHHKRPYFPDGLDPRIGLSPENIRTWLDTYIESAKESIIVYNQTVTDKRIIDSLSRRAQSGISIELCQAYRDGNTQFSPYIDSYSSKKPYLHAKIFLIDGKRIILGSANLTENALDNNREILLDIGENKELYKIILSLYQKDCKGQP